MVADQLKSGANTPCWLVFDANFRAKFTAGGFMPSLIMPDWLVGVDAGITTFSRRTASRRWRPKFTCRYALRQTMAT